MSTPTNSGPDEKSGMGKLLSRAKTVLRRKDGSKRFSLSGKSPATASTTTPSAAGPSTTKPSESTPVAAPAPVEETPAPVTTKEGPQPVKILRSQIDADRYNRLGQRFKLPAIEATDFSIKSDKEALRIEKAIRVRIHRTCHKCQTSFGGNKVCATCQHPRCSKCTRIPAKKTKKDDKENVPPKARAADWIEPDTYYGMQQKYVLTMPSKKPGGQVLVRKKPMQRVRRNCHECSALFQPGSKICTKCEHVRCADCPRDPAKKKKYPDGYPGDAYSATSTAPLKYKCHQCLKIFKPIPHPNSPEGIAAASDPPPSCIRCGHAKCSECPRAPIVKVDPAPDPEVLKSVAAKLARLNVGEPVEAA